jgi:hypothetical protein
VKFKVAKSVEEAHQLLAEHDAEKRRLLETTRPE